MLQPGSSSRNPEPTKARSKNVMNQKGICGGGRSDVEKNKCTKGKRTVSEGEDISKESIRLRWRINQLEKEKLDVMSKHNQQLHHLHLEAARLRSSVERGGAQRTELELQLTVSKREAERAIKLGEDRQNLRKQVEELQQKVQELQKGIDIARRAREEDQHSLQQEINERDLLIQSCTSKNQQLHKLLQQQNEAIEEAERRMAEVQKKRETEAEANRQQANDLKYVSELEERSRSEKEASIQKVKTLESKIEAERASHLEWKFNFEIMQLRVQDLEAVLAAEHSGQKDALYNLELLQTQFRELERVYNLEQEKANTAENALELLQKRQEQSMTDLEKVQKITAEFTQNLEKEKQEHCNTQLILEETTNKLCESEDLLLNFLREIRKTLQRHNVTGKVSSKEPESGNSSPPEILKMLNTTLYAFNTKVEVAEKRVQDLLFASERLNEENNKLQQLASAQKQQIEKCHQDIRSLHKERSRWLGLQESLQVELDKERKKKLDEKQEWEKRLDEREKECQEKLACVQKRSDLHQVESEERLSFLESLHQRLPAGRHHQSSEVHLTWKELCNVIDEQVEQLTSDLLKANNKVSVLQSACTKKSVCVRELQHRQQSLLSRLQERQRRRDDAWSSKHTLTVTQLQKELECCRSKCDSLNIHVVSLTADLTHAQNLLSKSHTESDSFLLAFALLLGTLTHTQRRLQTLCKQKRFLSWRLEEEERLAQEVRTLACALEQEEEKDGGTKRLRRWRRVVFVVLAVRRWRSIAQMTPAVFRLKIFYPSLSLQVRSEFDFGIHKRQSGDAGEDVCVQLLRSKHLASSILSSVADLQRTLTHTDSSPEDITSAARSGLTCLFDLLFCQSQSDSDSHSHGLSRQCSMKTQTLVSSLQQHFLLYSQRLHSAEVERRSLRQEVAALKRTGRPEKKEYFDRVCEQLQQALMREQEAQTLIQEQSQLLQSLQHRVNAQSTQQHNTQNSLKATTKSLSKVEQQVRKKECSLRILAKHLSGVHKERRRLEERIQQSEEELREAARCKDRLVSYMKAAEQSYKEVKDSFDQQHHSEEPRPLPSLRSPAEPEEGVRAAPEIIACQSLLVSVTQLFQTFSRRIDWLQQEVSTYQSHVTALRSELQENCILPQIPVMEIPQYFFPSETNTSRVEPTVSSSVFIPIVP